MREIYVRPTSFQFVSYRLSYLQPLIICTEVPGGLRLYQCGWSSYAKFVVEWMSGMSEGVHVSESLCREVCAISGIYEEVNTIINYVTFGYGFP